MSKGKRQKVVERMLVTLLVAFIASIGIGSSIHHSTAFSFSKRHSVKIRPLKIREIAKSSLKTNERAHSYGNWPFLNRSQDCQYAELAHFAANRHGLDPALVRAVIEVESGFKSNSRSPKGAIGLMQLMPSTARFVGVNDIHSPTQNVLGGSKYLKHLMVKFDNNISLALAAYNAGPSAVQKYRGIPPFPETRRYVNRVLSKYRQIQSS